MKCIYKPSPLSPAFKSMSAREFADQYTIRDVLAEMKKYPVYIRGYLILSTTDKNIFFNSPKGLEYELKGVDLSSISQIVMYDIGVWMIQH